MLLIKIIMGMRNGMNYGLSIFFMFVSLFISLVLPILAAIYVTKRHKASWKAILIGILVFIVFQPLTRFQLLRLWQKTSWYTYNSVVNPWMIYLIVGFSAGIFEEVGRFIAFKTFLKNKLQWKNGIAYGIGHGGIEAILLAGIAFAGLIITSLSNGLQGNYSSWIYLIGGFERLSAMAIHVAFSLMVMYGVKNRKNRYLLYAILLHGAVDAAVGFTKNILVIELIAAVSAVAILFFMIWRIKKSSRENKFVDIKSGV